MTDYRQLSKTLAHALRHAPSEYGISLTEEGWTSVPSLVKGLKGTKRWKDVTIEDIEETVQNHSGGRYEIRQGKIRAHYGHSVSEGAKHTSESPPPILYHGTYPDALNKIKSTGLLPMSRQHVHLAVDMEEAVRVGSRRAEQPVIIIVNAEVAFNNGTPFYRGSDKIWLADAVAPEFLDFDNLIFTEAKSRSRTKPYT